MSNPNGSPKSATKDDGEPRYVKSFGRYSLKQIAHYAKLDDPNKVARDMAHYYIEKEAEDKILYRELLDVLVGVQFMIEQHTHNMELSSRITKIRIRLATALSQLER